jgi:multidrug resistance efflux pump
LAEARLQPAQVNRDIRSEGSTERRSAEYQVQAAQHALAAAEADLVTAETLLRYLWWIHSEPLAYIAQANAAEGQYRAAEAAVAVAQSRLDDLLAGPTPEEIAVAEATVAKAMAEAEVVRLRVERSQLISPIDGVVTAQMLSVGELAVPAATVLELADLSSVTLEIYVPENRVGQVILGQVVGVSVDSFPERTFSGNVVKIGDRPEYTPRNVATAEERLNTFYAVEIELSNPEGLLKPGMPADARF